MQISSNVWNLSQLVIPKTFIIIYLIVCGLQCVHKCISQFCKAIKRVRQKYIVVHWKSKVTVESSLRCPSDWTLRVSPMWFIFRNRKHYCVIEFLKSESEHSRTFVSFNGLLATSSKIRCLFHSYQHMFMNSCHAYLKPFKASHQSWWILIMHFERQISCIRSFAI